MLEALRIRDLGVIADAEVEFGPGLCVVTGETGTGKTMVVTGLQLLFGHRADATRVRADADQATIEGRVRIGPDAPVVARVLDAGGQIEDGELLLRRTVTAAGRSRSQVGGTSTPIGVLGAVGEDLFAVHGQSDQMRLVGPGQQRRALDRAAGIDVGAYRAAFERWQSAERQHAERIRDRSALVQESDLLTFGLGDIDALAPEPGEDVELGHAAGRLGAADELRRAAQAAHDAILGAPDDPTSDAADVRALLGGAHRQLAAVAAADPQVAALADRLADLAAVAADLGADLAAYGDTVDADPIRLELIQSRRAELDRLARKYGASPGAGTDDVLDWAERARARLAEIDTSETTLERLSAQCAAARAAVRAEAVRLTRARRAAAGQLGRAVTAELHGLAMSQARLVVEVRPRPALAGSPSLDLSSGEDSAGITDREAAGGDPVGAGVDGVDDVEFLLSPAADSPLRALDKGASGGELSRVMLAVEVVLAGSDPVPILVFDEVDAGVGGRAAVEVGRRLARLARRHQVIVVTHLAQVAAFADRHLVVDPSGPAAPTADAATEETGDARGTRSGGGRSVVTRVDGAARLAELARMLAGRDTSAARRHAAELLADAQAAAAGDVDGAAGDVDGAAGDVDGAAAGYDRAGVALPGGRRDRWHDGDS